MPGPAKILFVAFDAADKDILLDGARAGRFPTLRSLLERACWGLVDNPIGLYIGALWPSFATGLLPARHGIYGFRQADPGSYTIRRTRPAEIRGDPFWSRLSRGGRRVAIIDLPRIDLSEGLNGLQVVDWRTHDPEFHAMATWPPELRGEVESSAGGRGRLRGCDSFLRAAEAPALRAQLLASVDDKLRVSEALLARGGWDLFLTVFTESHCAGHQFWHVHDASHPRHRSAGFSSSPLVEVYAALDAALAQLVERTGADTLIVFLASHGMGPHFGGGMLLDDLLKRIESVAPARWRRAERREPLDLWRRAPPPVRAALAPLRYRVIRRLDERMGRLDGRGRCFAVPNNDGFAGIRINVRGREPRGSVAPGSELEEFSAYLTRELLELVNPTTGRPAVNNVFRTEDLYCGPALAELPDLLVEWNQEAPVEAVHSARIGTIARRYDGIRSGDHRPQGMFLAVGSSVRPGRRERSVSITDFAPTICRLLGVAPGDVDGEPIQELGAAI